MDSTGYRLSETYGKKLDSHSTNGLAVKSMGVNQPTFVVCWPQVLVGLEPGLG